VNRDEMKNNLYLQAIQEDAIFSGLFDRQ
jgi:hypothetical protein